MNCVSIHQREFGPFIDRRCSQQFRWERLVWNFLCTDYETDIHGDWKKCLKEASHVLLILVLPPHVVQTVYDDNKFPAFPCELVGGKFDELSKLKRLHVKSGKGFKDLLLKGLSNCLVMESAFGSVPLAQEVMVTYANSLVAIK